MGSRGPKPKSEQERRAETESLKVFAQVWAAFFYTLRDGDSGVIQSVEWGPWEPFAGRVHKLPPGAVAKIEGNRFCRAKRIVEIKFLGLDTSVADEEKIFRELKKRDDLVVLMPVKPSLELWERFRDARTVSEHRRAVSRLEKWWRGRYGTCEGSLMPVPSFGESVRTSKDEFRLLASRALFEAKGLWLYPRTDRPKSDDKRIEFLAKAAAGLLHGIAPATALRKLTGVQFPKHFMEKQRREFVQRVQAEIKSRRVKS